MRTLLFSLFVACQAFAAQAQVVVSIKPLHSLVAGVMEGSGQVPTLLVDGAQSLHHFSLKPSQAQSLERADIVLYIDPQFETFLHKYSASPRMMALGNLPGLTRYAGRVGERGHENHHEEHEEHGHLHDAAHDWHLLLSVANARIMTTEIARVLSAQYPAHAALFSANAARMDNALQALDKGIAARMAKLQGKSFATFHDATQYFDRRYGLAFAGALTVHPEQGLSAKRVIALRTDLHALQVACVFREPSFDAKVIDALVQDTGARSVILDPEAALLPAGPSLYGDMMEAIAASMENCLSS